VVTRAGALVAGSAVVLLAAGTLADYPEIVMLGMACVAALVVGALWLLARPKLVAVRRIVPDRVPAGVAARGVLTVTNTGRRRSPPSLVVETVAGRHVTVPLPSIAAHGVTETVYALPSEHRGRYVLPALKIGHTDPLRLFRLERAGGGESVLYVHPRVHRIAALPLGGPRDVEGPTSAASPQGGVAFHSLRDYQPGDDRRRIHWRSTARTGTLMVRHNAFPDEPRHLVVLDTSEEPYRDDGADDTFEEAVQVAASVCVAADRTGFPVICRTTEDAPRPPDGDEEIQAALDLLAGARRTEADRGLSAIGDLLRDVATPGGGTAMTVVTGRAAPGVPELVRSAAEDHAATCLVHIGQTAQEGAGGVFTISAGTSTEFAVRWNRLFPL